jgi:hypothetical protein
VAPEGEIRYWKQWKGEGRSFPVVKVNGRWRHWARVEWEKYNGTIPKGMNVVFTDGNNKNLAIENLELITDAELSTRNAAKSIMALSDNYVVGTLTSGAPGMREAVKQCPELIELKRLTLKIKRQQNGIIK